MVALNNLIAHSATNGMKNVASESVVGFTLFWANSLDFTNCKTVAGHLILTWDMMPGRRYALSRATEVLGPWVELTGYEDVPGTGAPASFTNSLLDGSTYYRATVWRSE